ncbi:26707_t:CDS:2, partial [Racocetra persica]
KLISICINEKQRVTVAKLMSSGTKSKADEINNELNKEKDKGDTINKQLS